MKIPSLTSINLPVTSDPERLGLPSASAASRLAHCPGSWRMEMNMPQLGRYAALADSGTRIHNWLSGVKGETMSEDELRSAHSLASAKDRLVNAWRDTLPPGLGLIESVEQRHFLRSGIVPVCSGKWDYLATSGDHHLVIDYKTGWQDLPPVKQNLQLRVYALLVWSLHPRAESISVAIVRPGDEHSETPHFATYTSQELESALLWWGEVLGAAFQPSPVIVAGDHCQFCRAQHTCPARLDSLHKLRADSQIVTRWADLEPSQKADLLKLWKVVKKFGETVEEKCREDIEAGGVIPGVSLGKGRKMTEIEDVQAAYTRALSAGMTHDQFMAMVKVSFAKLRDSLAKNAGWKGKEAGAKAAELFAGLLHETSTKGALEIA